MIVDVSSTLSINVSYKSTIKPLFSIILNNQNTSIVQHSSHSNYIFEARNFFVRHYGLSRYYDIIHLEYKPALLLIFSKCLVLMKIVFLTYEPVIF